MPVAPIDTNLRNESMAHFQGPISTASEEEIPEYRLEKYQQPTPANLELYAACEAGDGVKASAALKSGGYPNYYDEEKGGFTAVHVAAMAEDCSALEALKDFVAAEEALAPRFDLKTTTLKSTPLHCAAQAGRASALKVLLNLPGVEIDGVNSYGNTALLLACAANARDCAKILVDAGSNPTVANKHGQTALHMAVAGVAAAIRKKEEGDDVLSVVRLILSEAANANAVDGNGQTPLHHVATMRENDTVIKLAKLLLSKGAHSKIRDNAGKRPSEIGSGRATPRGDLMKILKQHEMFVIDTAC